MFDFLRKVLGAEPDGRSRSAASRGRCSRAARPRRSRKSSGLKHFFDTEVARHRAARFGGANEANVNFLAGSAARSAVDLLGSYDRFQPQPGEGKPHSMWPESSSTST
ncbi:MAG: hypothetical protein R2724_18895 [Bryobacterales bacterium]